MKERQINVQSLQGIPFRINTDEEQNRRVSESPDRTTAYFPDPGASSILQFNPQAQTLSVAWPDPPSCEKTRDGCSVSKKN